MHAWTRWTSNTRYVVVGLGCVLALITISTLFFHSDDGFYRKFSPVSTPLPVDTPTIESWPYIEIIQPEDKNVWPYRVFRSSPSTPPSLNITNHGGDVADGHLFITPGNRSWELSGQHQGGPFIIGMDNELVYRHEETMACHDFRVQNIDGEPHLIYWHGERAVGHGYGNVIIMDSTYEESRLGTSMEMQWMAPDHFDPPGWTDFHENQMTSRGTILVTSYNDTFVDLSTIGGSSNTSVTDSLILEIDLNTGETIFVWSALDHVPIQASQIPLVSSSGNGKVGYPWDHFHINSLQDTPEGILVSGRHTWSIYLISRETGEVIWTLDGSGDEGSGDYAPLPVEGQFRWQHHARIYRTTEDSVYLSLFDNHYMKDVNQTQSSRGLLLKLPHPPNKDEAPRVVGNLETAEPTYSDSQGSVDTTLSNGNILVAYGPIPVVREFGLVDDGSVELRWEARFGNDNRAMSYRAFKSEWHATPQDWDPSLVVEYPEEEIGKAGNITARAYVSWNGATDVEAWNVYLHKPLTRVLVGQAAKVGFETVFDLDVPAQDSCLQIGAVQDGAEIRNSSIICL